MSTLLAIRIVDVNGNPVPNAVSLVRDSAGGSLPGTIYAGGLAGADTAVFDLKGLSDLEIGMTAPSYFAYSVKLTRDYAAGTLEVNARSPQWGLFSTETLPLTPMLTLRARRVQAAPFRAFSIPVYDQAPPIVGDPGGIWIDGRTMLVKDLYTGGEKDFEFVPGPDMLGDPEKDDWDRFKKAVADVNPEAPYGGSFLCWLEYGDPGPSGERMLLAVWVLNRAAARADRKVGVHVFLGPPTNIDFYAPAQTYPYKIKRIGSDLVQPYSHHAHTYLSTQSGPGGRPAGAGFAIAYQSLASSRSHILIMPLNAYGFRGPLPCRAGLLRLVREVTGYISDNTNRTLPPRSTFSTDAAQSLDRVAVSGYSSGAVEAARLFTTATIRDLSETYRANRKDKEAQDWAQRLERLKAELWESQPSEFDRMWKEFYSVDGFYGSDEAGAFPRTFAPWFAADEERMLRVYATRGRMKDSAEVVRTRLDTLFKGVSPQVVSRKGAPTFMAQHWQRRDNRATLAWFADDYMQFVGVNRMPRYPESDAHHTIPRIVFAHALSQSGFAPI